MTSIRFSGDLPLWLAVPIAVLAVLGVWRYYRRESAVLSPLQRRLLPVLRALALVLVILLLTGPVLRHRSVTGELGHVRIYLDASESMTLRVIHPCLRGVNCWSPQTWVGLTLAGCRIRRCLTLQPKLQQPEKLRSKRSTQGTRLWL